MTTYWCTPSGDSIPTFLSWESSSLTTEARSDGDIGKVLVGLAVQPWVDETEWLLASSEKGIVDESNNSSKGRAGRGSSTDGGNVSGPDNHIVITLSGNIGVGTTGLLNKSVSKV